MAMLTPWPLYDQNTDWTVDADGIDENRENNCGPESVAMCLKYLTGIELPADFIKDALYGQNYTGYSFMNDLAGFLRKRCEVKCDIHVSQDASLQPVIQDAIDQGFPVIVLFYWRREQPESGHFAPVVGYDDKGVSRANPWGGQMEYMTWPDFEAWQKQNQCIVLRRRRVADLDRGLEPDPLLRGVQEMRQEAEQRIGRRHRELSVERQ